MVMAEVIESCLYCGVGDQMISLYWKLVEKYSEDTNEGWAFGMKKNPIK